MLPICFEWHWNDPSRLIFMGLLYVALGAVGTGLGIAFLMTLFNLKKGGGHESH